MTVLEQKTYIDEKEYRNLLGTNVKKEIKDSVFTYLSKDINELPNTIKDNIIKFKDEIGEGDISLENIEIEQFVIKDFGEKHKQVDFVLNIKKDGKDFIKSVSTVSNKKTGEIIDITFSDEKDANGNILMEKSMVANVFMKNPNLSGLEGVKIENDEIDENILEGVTEKWNEKFEKNRSDLKGKSEDEKKSIVINNAKKIRKLFSGVLQGTVEKGNSAFDFINRYFEHFLMGSPVLHSKNDIEYNKIEDGALIAKGKYVFEAINDEGQPKYIYANFTFKFEKINGVWSIAGLHSYLNLEKN